jgi:hypothetical protein
MRSISNYNECRERFRKEAAAAGLSLSWQLIPGRGIHDEELTQDYAYLDKGSTITFIHLSGVHGVEGYLGSAVQSEILQDHELLKNSRHNILFVHAVNPYGMSWSRRTNSNNIDLNRNCFLPSATPDNKDINRFQKFLQSRSKAEILFRFPQLLISALILGTRRVSQAIAGGQWKFPRLLFFGGHEVQPELLHLMANIQRLSGGTQKYCVLDVHTGLGPSAYDSLLAPLSQHQQIPFFIQATAEKKEASHILDLTRSQEMYQSQASLELLFENRFPSQQIFFLVQEFGTKPVLSVLSSLILENSAFYSQSLSPEKRSQILLQSFFPNSEAWYSKSVSQWKKRFTQILLALDSSSLSQNETSS